jgi:IS5 family transposase
MPWNNIEAALAPVLARKANDGRTVVGEDLFGPTLAVAGAGVSAAGRPRLPIRLMVGLLYLKHAFNKSDESVCERWAENVYWVRQQSSQLEDNYMTALEANALCGLGCSGRGRLRSGMKRMTLSAI